MDKFSPLLSERTQKITFGQAVNETVY